jgi:hypothetical protein
MGKTTLIFMYFNTCFRNIILAHIYNMATYSASVKQRVIKASALPTGEVFLDISDNSRYAFMTFLVTRIIAVTESSHFQTYI